MTETWPNRFGETEAEVNRVGLGWESAEIRYRAWARTNLHKKRVARAEEIARDFVDNYAGPMRIAWSGGKDSTALVHLITQRCGLPVRAMSIKDDLDYPEELNYIGEFARRFNIDLDVVEPGSLAKWLTENRDQWEAGEDLHGRKARLSELFFYNVLDAYRERNQVQGVFIGLRAGESAPRTVHLASRGPIYYQGHSKQFVCCPLAYWEAGDVYAYLLKHDVELLPCYRYVGEGDDPGRIRKSWFLPGAHCRHGSASWLRRWRPKLWAWVIREWPEFSRWA